MRLSILEEFVELANCLSFSKAAARLHISQPALSMHIGKLEQDIGATLVSRERPISLTAAGRLLYDNAGKMLALRDETIRGCRELDGSAERGFLNIKMDYAHESIKIAFHKLVSSFRKEHPSVKVSIVPQGGAHGSVVEGSCDDLINVWFYSTSFDEQLEAHRIAVGAEPVLMAECELALWMRAGNPMAQEGRVSIREIAGMKHPLPMGESFAELRDASIAVLDAYGVKVVFRNALVDSFVDFIFDAEEDEVFIMADHPLDPERDGFMCRCFDPPIEHRNYLMIKSDESNPALSLFESFVRENWEVVFVGSRK